MSPCNSRPYVTDPSQPKVSLQQQMEHHLSNKENMEKRQNQTNKKKYKKQTKLEAIQSR